MELNWAVDSVGDICPGARVSHRVVASAVMGRESFSFMDGSIRVVVGEERPNDSREGG